MLHIQPAFSDACPLDMQIAPGNFPIMNLIRNPFLSRSIMVLMPVLLLLFAGCGDDQEAARKAEKERSKSALNKLAGLKMRFQQLDATLSQLESESDIQKQKVSAAKAELR